MRFDVEKRTLEVFGRPDKVYFWDHRNQREYRRVVGAVAWSVSGAPGFILIIAEDANKHPRTKRYIYRVLNEYSSHDAEKMVKRMAAFQGLYAVSDWYGDDEDSLALFFVDKFNQGKKKGLCITNAPFARATGNLKLYSNMIFSRVEKAKKTLYFGDDSVLPATLSNIVLGDMESKLAEQIPPLAALGYAVMGLNEPLVEVGQDALARQRYIDTVSIDGL